MTKSANSGSVEIGDAVVDDNVESAVVVVMGVVEIVVLGRMLVANVVGAAVTERKTAGEVVGEKMADNLAGSLIGGAALVYWSTRLKQT